MPKPKFYTGPRLDCYLVLQQLLMQMVFTCKSFCLTIDLMLPDPDVDQSKISDLLSFLCHLQRSVNEKLL